MALLTNDSRMQVLGGPMITMRSAYLVEPARIRAALAQCPLFWQVPIGCIEEAARTAEAKRIAGGGVLLMPGQPVLSVGVVVSGQLRTVAVGDSGKEVTLATLRMGGAFGEDCVFANEASAQQVMAVEPTTYVELARETFMRLAQAYPQILSNALRLLASRVRKADATIAQLALYNVNERLIKCLVGLAASEGQPCEDGIQLRRRPTQQEIANMIGSCRETVSRACNQLARNGKLVMKGRSLVVTRALLEQVPVV